MQNAYRCIFYKIAIAHKANASMMELHRIFSRRIISKNLWFPQSPDFTPCDFHLWGILKNKIYAGNPHRINKLEENIISAVESISAEELLKVNNNFKRCQQCVRNNGDIFSTRYELSKYKLMYSVSQWEIKANEWR